ncbi:Protein BATH-38 [Aphelenchoides avenae]|nr:Protein BATH-38 [Aphelenchus avenae]
MSKRGDPTLKETLTLKISNISTYSRKIGQRTESPRRQVAGIEWHILAYPTVVDNVTYLGCYLAGTNAFKWSASVDANFAIVTKNRRGTGNSFRKRLMGKEPLADTLGWSNFVTSEGLLSATSGFVVNDAVEIRVDFGITDVCGTSFNVFETAGALGADIKLKVGDSIFHANKGYLSVVSSVFRDMFPLTEANKESEELELKDLVASDFKEFLGVIYPTSYPITDANVISVFRMADRYDVQRVIADCERHLLGANSVPWFDKLKLAGDLRRDHLQNQLIAMMTCNDIRTIKLAANRDQLGKDVLLSVYEKHYLSVVSSVFRETFALTEATKCEEEMEVIELQDLDAGEFKVFLAVIYPTRYPVNDANVISVFRLADRFDVQHVVADCETRLVGVNGVPWFDKLKLTVDLRRDHLRKELIEMMTCDDIKTVKLAENKDQLGDGVLRAIFEKHFGIHHP